MRIFREIKGKIRDVGLSTGNRALNRLALCFPAFFLWRNTKNNFLYPEEPPACETICRPGKVGKEEPFCHQLGGGSVTIRNELRHSTTKYVHP